jgi:hypothetical protein
MGIESEPLRENSFKSHQHSSRSTNHDRSRDSRSTLRSTAHAGVVTDFHTTFFQESNPPRFGL